MRKSKNKKDMKLGEEVKVSPVITGLDNWIEGTIIDIEKNPFRGIVVSVKDNLNRIFFGNEQYFKPINVEKLCLQ